MKRFELSRRGVALGIALVAALVIFLGVRAANAQAVAGQKVVKLATINDLWEKSDLIDQRLQSMDAKIDRLREQMDYLLKNMEREWRKTR